MHLRIRGAIAAAALAIVAGSVVAPTPTRAAGAAGIPFAEAFDRARLVVVAVVDAAPPGDPAYRLTVSEVVKGDAAPSIAFPADQTSVTLARGTTVLLLAMDPASLDFRGTWVLAIAPDGTIDPDGLAGAPATVDDLIATYGAAAATAGSAAAPTGPGTAGIAGLLAVVAIAALTAARVRAVRRGRRRMG